MAPRFFLAAVVVLVTGAVRLDAQVLEPIVRVTVEEAVARASEHSQRLAELRAREEAAGAVTAGRDAADKPIVSLQGGYTRTNHVDEFRIVQPGLPARVLYPDIPDNFRARVDLQWPVYTAGRTSALRAAAAAEQAAVGEEVSAARADLRLEVTRAFWALVTARESEGVVARAVDNLDAHVRDLRTRLEQGLIPPNEVLTAEAQRSRQRVYAIEARNARMAIEADMGRLMGAAAESRIDPVVPASDRAAPAAVAANAAALVAQALQQRPERRALHDRVEAARARLRAASTSRLPQAAVTAGYDYARPNPRIFPRAGRWDDSWDISITAMWSLWDGGRRRAEEREGDAIVRAMEARVAEFDRQVELDVRQRLLDVESSEAAVAAAGDAVVAATEARRVVGERYRAGVATSTDVLDAELAVLQVELDRTRAIANAHLSQARLRRATGRAGL